jgi:hypothetical protein
MYEGWILNAKERKGLRKGTQRFRENSALLCANLRVTLRFKNYLQKELYFQ